MADGRYKDDINSGLYPTYVEPETAAYQQQRAEKKQYYGARKMADRTLQDRLNEADVTYMQQEAKGFGPGGAEAAQKQREQAQNAARVNWGLAMNTLGWQPPGAPKPARQAGNTGEPVALTETAKTAVEQPTTATQPAEQTERQPATGPGMMNLVREIPGRDGQPAIGVYRGQHGDVYVQGTPGQPGYGEMQMHGRPQAQGQSRPGLGLNGMRDLGNGQVAVGQVDGFQNPGYGFKGSREDAARFFQPVGRPGGYNPYRQRFRTLFDEQMDARRAARATPSEPQMDMTLPGQSRRAKYQAQMQAYNNALNQAYGFDAGEAARALEREQMAQQYGINMAQLGNDNLRTQAALGLSGLQQQQAQNQMAWDAEKLKAYQEMSNARPGSKEWIAARDRFTALNGTASKSGQGRTFKEVDPETGEISYWKENDDGEMQEVVKANGHGGGLSSLFEGDQLEQALSHPAAQAAWKKGPKEFAAYFRKFEEAQRAGR